MNNSLIYILNTNAEAEGHHTDQEGQCLQQLSDAGVEAAESMVLSDCDLVPTPYRPGLAALRLLCDAQHIGVLSVAALYCLGATPTCVIDMLKLLRSTGVTLLVGGRTLDAAALDAEIDAMAASWGLPRSGPNSGAAVGVEAGGTD